MFVRFMHVLLTTELRSFSGNGSCTSERGSSGFFSFTLGKTFDCTNELHIKKTELKSTKCKLTTGLKVPKTSNKYSKSSIQSTYSRKNARIIYQKYKPTHSQKDLHENWGVTALAAEMIWNSNQQPTKHREKHRNVLRIPGVLKTNIIYRGIFSVL